ncbi:MAG: hypothetical protein ABEN55_11385, partial [Bradymonadaceae bacterium]
GNTCEFDHTQFSHRRLARSRGRVFAVALRSHASGTATWKCGEQFNDLPDRSGCGWTIPDSETETDKTLMVGDVSNGTSDLRPVSIDGGIPYDRDQVPTQTSFVVRGGHPWSTETEGAGTLHLALLGSAEDRYEKSAVRYLALRCP